MTESGNKKTKVLREKAKDLQTSHWDLDYISRDELERLMSKPQPGPADTQDQSPDRDKSR